MSNPVIHSLLTRRSIRTYKSDPIPPVMRETLLRAAMHAPSAMDQQPWEFIVVEDREILKSIPTLHSHSGLVAQAPLAILVCGDTRRIKLDGYWIQDCSAATQNLLMAAHALELGAVWVGVYPNPDNTRNLQKSFGMPDEVIPFSLVAVGFPDEPCLPKDTYLPERIHHNRWE